MPRREGRRGRPGLWALIWAGVRRSGWQSAAGLLAGLVSAGALAVALGLLGSMQQVLDRGTADLGGDLILALPGNRTAVEQWMQKGQTDLSIVAKIDLADWQERLKEVKVIGIRSSQGIDLTRGGLGEPSGPMASIVAVRLESWASPLMIKGEIGVAIPGAEVILGEQTTRHVLSDLGPLVRILSVAAGVALLGAVAVAALLASIRVAERRSELGMLRAMGASRRFMIALTLGESMTLALSGGLTGLVVALVALASMPLADGPLALLHPGWLLAISGLSLAATAVSAGLAALLPALHSARMDPLDAVRRFR